MFLIKVFRFQKFCLNMFQLFFSAFMNYQSIYVVRKGNRKKKKKMDQKEGHLKNLQHLSSVQRKARIGQCSQLRTHKSRDYLKPLRIHIVILLDC